MDLLVVILTAGRWPQPAAATYGNVAASGVSRWCDMSGPFVRVEADSVLSLGTRPAAPS
jgi:hypothetical protein